MLARRVEGEQHKYNPDKEYGAGIRQGLKSFLNHLSSLILANRESQNRANFDQNRNSNQGINHSPPKAFRER